QRLEKSFETGLSRRNGDRSPASLHGLRGRDRCLVGLRQFGENCIEEPHVRPAMAARLTLQGFQDVCALTLIYHLALSDKADPYVEVLSGRHRSLLPAGGVLFTVG